MSALFSFFQERSTSLFAVLVLTGTYLLYNILQRTAQYFRHVAIIKENGCKAVPSYPHKDPIFGFDLFFEGLKLSKTGGFFDRVQERFNRVNGGVNTFSQLLLGERVLNTTEPENIKAILATKFKDFELPARRKNAFIPLMGHGIFTTDGKEWETSRALLRPNFSRSLIGDLDIFESHISKMIDRIPLDGSTVDLQELFFMLTLDSATDFLFGQSTNVLVKGESSIRGEKFGTAFQYTTEKIGMTSRLGKLATLVPDKKYEDGIKYCQEYVQEYVHKAIAQQESGEKSEQDSPKYVFLDQLARTGTGAKKIQDELLNILVAGRDTTASLLAHLWYILARRPDVFNKLRAEVSQLGDKQPSFEEIKDLKYLQWTLNEALRLHPIVPSNARMAIRDTVLPLGGGPDGKSPILVKTGTQVNYQVWIMHRRKDLYGEDAKEFKPERWEKLRPSWQYLPFNGGPRICIGQQFALTETAYTTIRLLQAFKSIENRDPTDYSEILTLTMAVRNGVQVGLTPA